MKNLNLKTQLFVVEEVKSEMRRAEHFLKNWKVSWWEQLSEAHCEELCHSNIGMDEIMRMEKKYGQRYKLESAIYHREKTGVPLATASLIAHDYTRNNSELKFDVEFARIDWLGMNTKRCERAFTFYNDGTINFFKHSLDRVSYDSTFNVLDYDFNMDIKAKPDIYGLSLKGRYIKERSNNVEIYRQLDNSKKKVRIIKQSEKRTKTNNESLLFEAGLNTNNTIEYAHLDINTHKGNNKVNGTYRLEYNREKGVGINFYSRKGNKIDISNNPYILYYLSLLVEPILQNGNSDMIISEFISAIYTAIANKSNTIDFSIKYLDKAERELVDLFKSVKGEIPLAGLVTRIENVIERIVTQPLKQKEEADKLVLKQ